METLNTTELLKELVQTSQNLTNTLNLFNDIQFNTIPFKGSWTAGQVAAHLYKSEKGMPDFLNNNTRPTTRNADENVKQLKEIFLDYSVKFEASESLLPSDEDKNKAELIDLLTKNKDAIITLASTLDLTQTCTSFEMPGLGALTRFEWLWFIIYHNTRHIRQLKNIHSIISKQ